MEPVGHLVPLGHHVPGQDLAEIGLVEELLQLGEVGVFDDPRLVGEDVQAAARGDQHEVDLGPVAAREHDRVAGLLAVEALEPVGAGAEVEFPGGRVVVAGVEGGDAVDVGDGVAIERAVDEGPAMDAGTHALLHQGGVEVAGSERDQSDRLHRGRDLEILILA